MVDEWEAQNILTNCITKDILGILTMDNDQWHFNPQYMGWKSPFFLRIWVDYPQKIKGGLSYGKNGYATIKYYWVHYISTGFWWWLLNS
jgi:hypothetical protein